MNTPEAALGRKTSGAMWAQGPWLHSQRWDLLYITGRSCCLSAASNKNKKRVAGTFVTPPVETIVRNEDNVILQ